VADFALEWRDGYGLYSRPGLVTRLDRHVEGSVVRAADRITVAYSAIAWDICGRFGEVPIEKISVIPTGFAEDLFQGSGGPASGKCTVLYPGNHFCEEGRHGECFLKAVDQWTGSDPGLRDRVEFVFMGKRDDELLRSRAQLQHPEVVRVEPLMPHRTCVEAIRSSDICVVNAVHNRIPCKVYECMRAGKPILALTDPGSDLESLMHGYRMSISVAPQDVSGIREALRQLYQYRRSGGAVPVGTDSSVAAYSSRRSAEKVSRIFESLVAQPRQTPFPPPGGKA
jgi:hypothetical protein